MNIRLEGIIKSFGDKQAVNNLSLDIENGELVSILGPSGCGKSTTLFLIAGLLEATKGKIYFNGEDVTSLEAKDREIGMVFQNYALYPHLTVFDNIAFPLKMKKLKKRDIDYYVREMAKLNKIEELLGRKPSELSGGQQQRVAIARALVKKPKILLLDEPLSNLDARLRIEMREEIRKLQKELGITTVFVTHDQEEAMSISDKILLMKDGELQQYTGPREMYLEPANKFVAKFIGNPSMNLINGSLKSGYFYSDTGDVEIRLDEWVKDNEKLTLGVRPEDLIISDIGDYMIKGKVRSIQTIGKEIYVKLSISDMHDFILVASWDYELEIGQEVYLRARKWYFF